MWCIYYKGYHFLYILFRIYYFTVFYPFYLSIWLSSCKCVNKTCWPVDACQYLNPLSSWVSLPLFASHRKITEDLSDMTDKTSPSTSQPNPVHVLYTPASTQFWLWIHAWVRTRYTDAIRDVQKPNFGSVSVFKNRNRTEAKRSNPKFRFPWLFLKPNLSHTNSRDVPDTGR